MWSFQANTRTAALLVAMYCFLADVHQYFGGTCRSFLQGTSSTPKMKAIMPSESRHKHQATRHHIPKEINRKKTTVLTLYVLRRWPWTVVTEVKRWTVSRTLYLELTLQILLHQFLRALSNEQNKMLSFHYRTTYNNPISSLFWSADSAGRKPKQKDESSA